MAASTRFSNSIDQFSFCIMTFMTSGDTRLMALFAGRLHTGLPTEPVVRQGGG